MPARTPTRPFPPAIDVPVDPRVRQQHAWHERRLPPHGAANASAAGRYRPKPLVSSTVSGGSSISRGHRSGGKKEIFCAFGIDVDAVAGWLGSYGGEDSPCDISRGLFAGEVGVPRLVELFRRFGIRTTWFIPGHSVETFPDQCRMAADAGHEIGVHGYSHENPIAMTREQETAVLDKCIDLIEKLSGRRPTGYVAPWWEFSPVTNELLLERGIKYDHSLMNNDFHPFYVRVGDSWTKIDYGRDAREWMKPLVRGRGDRAHRHSRQLVPRRPTTDDVHEGGSQQLRIHQSPGYRGSVARPVRLGPTARTTTRCLPSPSTPTSRDGLRCC